MTTAVHAVFYGGQVSHQPTSTARNKQTTKSVVIATGEGAEEDVGVGVGVREGVVGVAAEEGVV